MLTVGDKVVYPMHGAGVIEGIEECEVMGEIKQYYVLRMPFGGMKVMIPMNNVDSIGLREVIAETEVEKVANVLREPLSEVIGSWNRRFNANLFKIKTGNVFDVAEVVKNLVLQDKVKKISTGERRLLDTAKQILISELELACHNDAETVEAWMYTLLEENTPGN